MHQAVRITCGALAAAALSACVVVPAHRAPPPAYGRVEYQPAPPPPPPPERVEYRRAPPPPPERVEFRFHDRQRELAREYYKREYHDRGRCPPGLARKHNRCEPPRHRGKWERGKPLPRDVAYRPVPHDLEVRMGPPPRGYRYVDVAGDILMIAVGTAVVVDAIQDLNR
jgi:Ni/Co efflux regulator RcnB